jgi:L-fucose isomerase-like protein
MAAQRTMTFGVVVGNRGFFPDHLAKTGREEILAVLEAAGARTVVLSPDESKHGAVETYEESKRCADLFKQHAEEIDGIIVTLPNFGEERGIVDAIRLSGLKVPVLVQATPDRSDNMTIAVRRDSFCGKMSACNNMMQYGISYSLTTLHTFGTCVGRVKSGEMSYARFSTDDGRGVIRGYTGKGRFTDDPLHTFGGAGVAEIPQLQKLLKYICREGFEHHVAANFSDVSKAIHEAATVYLGWESYVHGATEE